jgi:hypothetical protein
MFFWFASWPLGVLANIEGKQATNLVLQVILLVSRVASLVIGGILGSDMLAITLFSISGILVYIAYALICLRMIHYPLRLTVPFLAQQTMYAALPVAFLYVLQVVLVISPLGMVIISAVVSVLYFLLVMRKSVF